MRETPASLSRPATAVDLSVRRASPTPWIVGAALAVITAINYLDRQILPVVIGEIQKDIPVSHAEFARLQALFLLAYTIMYAGGGWLVDRWGTRAGYALIATGWSIACALHGAAQSVAGLGAMRFLLGLGEGGGFPASAKAVAEWFPPQQRSMAIGLFNTGSSLGAVLAPPLVAFLVLASGWRLAFVVTGAFGLIWAMAWLWILRGGTPVQSAAARPATIASWAALLRLPQVWTLLAAKFLTDGAWFFFIFWLPKYLGEARGFDMAAIGRYGWIPYACAGFGSLASGYLSAALMRRHVPVDRARKIALGASAALMPLSLFVVTSPIAVALAFVSLAFLGHQAWSVIVQTLPTDLFPAERVGSVAGLIGSAGSLGAMLFNLLVGVLLDASGSYGVPFLLAGLMHPISFILIVLTLRIAPVRTGDA